MAAYPRGKAMIRPVACAHLASAFGAIRPGRRQMLRRSYPLQKDGRLRVRGATFLTACAVTRGGLPPAL